MHDVARRGLALTAAAGGLVLSASGTAMAGSSAVGNSSDSPGVISGNTIQVPVEVPVNVCGDTIDVVGLLNPALGNTCVNHDSSAPKPIRHRQPVASAPRPTTSPVAQTPPVTPAVSTTHSELAHTGATHVGPYAAGAAAALVAGFGLLRVGRRRRATV